MDENHLGIYAKLHINKKKISDIKYLSANIRMYINRSQIRFHRDAIYDTFEKKANNI